MPDSSPVRRRHDRHHVRDAVHVHGDADTTVRVTAKANARLLSDDRQAVVKAEQSKRDKSLIERGDQYEPDADVLVRQLTQRRILPLVLAVPCAPHDVGIHPPVEPGVPCFRLGDHQTASGVCGGRLRAGLAARDRGGLVAEPDGDVLHRQAERTRSSQALRHHNRSHA